MGLKHSVPSLCTAHCGQLKLAHVYLYTYPELISEADNFLQNTYLQIKEHGLTMVLTSDTVLIICDWAVGLARFYKLSKQCKVLQSLKCIALQGLTYLHDIYHGRS